MTGLLEDFLTDDDVLAIDAVLASNVSVFDELVRISSLDPATDFLYSDLRYLDMRGADLRGFNFTGSDLRQCIINRNTLFDDTTVFVDALLDWIEVEALPIVQQMQEIEMASASEKRQALLKELIAEHGRSTHVVTYMTKAAGNANELEKFLDFATQLPASLSADQISVIREHGLKLLTKKFKQARSRTKRERTAIFAVEPILSRLKDSPGELGRVLYSHVAEVVNTKDQTKALRGTAIPEPADVETAFSRLGQQ